MVDHVDIMKRHDFWYKHAEQIESVVNCLEDEKSVLCYLSRIKALLFGDPGYIRMSEYMQYFHPKVRASEGDTILDAGIGPDPGTPLSFLRCIGSEGRVLAFEPMQANLESLRIEVARYPQISLIEQGLSDRDGTAEFTVEGVISTNIAKRRDYEGSIERVSLTSIDNFVASKNFSINLIKMDIEGAEQKALIGGYNTITKWKPKLQIALYHSDSDFLNIPTIVKGIDSRYRIWIGHHTPYGNECILYASVEE